MTPDQIEKLAAIETELVEVFVEECKPKAWPGMAKKDERGDRYWYKKNALATLTLAARIQTLLRDVRGDGGKTADEDEDLDGDKARKAEAEALTRQGVAILERHRARKKR